MNQDPIVGTDLQVGPRLSWRDSRPRLHGFEYSGHNAYHIVTATVGRECVFDDFELGRGTCLVLEEEASARGFVLLAYCLMPDHLHVLAAGRDDSSNLVRFVQVFKQRTGYAYKRSTGRQLWQASYYDHVVRREEDLGAIARYIFENPLEAGLVSDPRHYELAGGEYFRLVAEGAEPASERDRAKAPSLRRPLLREKI